MHRGVAGGEIETLGFDPFLGSGGVYRWLVPYWQLGGELLSPDKEKVTLNNERAAEALTWLKKVVDSQKAWAERVVYYSLLNQPDYKLAYQHYFPGKI